MISNLGPRPYVPGCPVDLYGLSTDEKPKEWLGMPIANGSRFNEMDKNRSYVFDAYGENWHIWTDKRSESGGSGSSEEGPSGNTASDSDVDGALDALFPSDGGIEGDDTPSGNTATDEDVNDAFDDLFGT